MLYPESRRCSAVADCRVQYLQYCRYGSLHQLIVEEYHDLTSRNLPFQPSEPHNSPHIPCIRCSRGKNNTVISISAKIEELYKCKHKHNCLLYTQVWHSAVLTIDVSKCQMCIWFVFATANGRSCMHLLIHPKQQDTALPCRTYTNKHCCQICTILELRYRLPTSETGKYLQMPSIQKLIQGIQSINQESCHGHQTLLGSSDQTSSVTHNIIFLSHIQMWCILFWKVCESKSRFHQ